MAERKALIIGGLSGTGSSTASKEISKQLDMEYIYAGGIFRRFAKEAGETIEKYNETLKDNPDFERRIDIELIERAQAGNVLVESRVLGWILPTKTPSFRVWMVCQKDERVRRINLREQTTRESIFTRERLEEERYETLYQIDQSDFSPYDLLIDTSKLPPGATAERIIEEYRIS